MIYKDLYNAFEEVVEEKKMVANYDDLLYDLIRLNPEYYRSYLLASDYFVTVRDTADAIKYLEIALTKEFENTVIKKEAIDKLNKLKEAQNDSGN